MPNGTPKAKQFPIDIVGGSTFGKYPKINAAKTLNMFISDEWLVNFSGFEKVLKVVDDPGEGRAAFHSVRGGFILIVIDDQIWRIDENLNRSFIGSLNTFTGEVYMDENLSSQIVIVDGTATAFLYNYNTGKFVALTLDADLVPNYVTYQNTHFIFGNANTTNAGSDWFVYVNSTATTLSLSATLTLQTKPDFAVAALRMPGKGNNLLVFGRTVCEIWTNVGGLEVYRRNSSLNIDYGVLNVSTIAANDQMICWLGVNEKSGPSIMVLATGLPERLSTDGIDELFRTLVEPEKSTAFFYRQDGHLFYVLTFFGKDDNLTLAYDFNVKKFFHLTDFRQNYFPARQIVFFDNRIFFVNLNDGDLYEMNTAITTYEGEQIPRIRVCSPFRLPTADRFIVNKFTYTIEQGTEPDLSPINECSGELITEITEDTIVTEAGVEIFAEHAHCMPYMPRVDMSISKTGGETFSNFVPRELNFTGHYRNQISYNRLGAANDFVVQLRFQGLNRFVVNNGVIEVYS